MRRFIKSSIRTFSILFFAFSGGFVLHAKESGESTTQAPPVVSESIDSITHTQLYVFAPESLTKSKSYQTVEDTILPPCDVIFFKSGKLEYCKIYEETPTTVSYKMCDYLDGPTIIANKSSIKKIRYATGKEEVIAAEQQTFDTTPLYTRPHRDPVAIWSLISSLSSIIFLPGALVGIILGFISLGRIRRSNGELTGRGSARTGIFLGMLVILILVITL